MSLQREAPWSADENWCWFDRVLSYSELLSPSEQCIFLQECSALFILSLQWKFNCCYFSWDDTGLTLSILERTLLWEQVIELCATRVSGVISRQGLLPVNDVPFLCVHARICWFSETNIQRSGFLLQEPGEHFQGWFIIGKIAWERANWMCLYFISIPKECYRVEISRLGALQ